jgi:hypothetical protein
VDARTLYADIRRDLSKAEAAETAELHAPFGSIHDPSFNVTYGVSPMTIYRSFNVTHGVSPMTIW